MPKRSIYPGYATFKSSNGYSRKTRSLNDASVALGQRIDLTQLRVPIFLLAAGKVVSADQLFATTRLVGTPAELLHTHKDNGELAKAEQKAGGFAQDVIKAEQRTKLLALTAPVDGVVQQLAVHTVGGVVTPAQALLAVVPLDSHLEIEAMVSNRDIGFVHPGQQAEVKVDTFSFTRYGLLHGEVINVSQDAITRDKPQDKSNDKTAGTETTSSEPKGQEMNYAARVSLDRTQMQIDAERTVILTPETGFDHHCVVELAVQSGEFSPRREVKFRTNATSSSSIHCRATRPAWGPGGDAGP
ncbi:HlyD family efflux transporter periplasmic adaptor subunit [Bradyrhizobium sp. Ash2021]|uniref:HlyD family efflux transporter periplasmic adaptor subunit n=1 Tax=Bradyrhizobium sp. Ash2021 TaxID=2954771 RepID=UPI002816783F|nr:HlyD family efflux transporter periplasmic adaptor subunit [Bradyrhizobium sp. Ash2021]